MQNEIDRLRREKLTLELLAAVLGNQLNGTPKGMESGKQHDALLRAAVETAQLDDKIGTLIRLRDAQNN